MKLAGSLALALSASTLLIAPASAASRTCSTVDPTNIGACATDYVGSVIFAPNVGGGGRPLDLGSFSRVNSGGPKTETPPPTTPTTPVTPTTPGTDDGDGDGHHGHHHHHHGKGDHGGWGGPKGGDNNGGPKGGWGGPKGGDNNGGPKGGWGGPKGGDNNGGPKGGNGGTPGNSGTPSQNTPR
jgi:hypothetical protein